MPVTIPAMKSRLNLTIKKQLLMKAKRYAASRKTSVSKVVENYFATLPENLLSNKKPEKGALIKLIESLPKPKVPKGDLVKLYYKRNRKKYGF
jgi:hypothetical protein